MHKFVVAWLQALDGDEVSTVRPTTKSPFVLPMPRFEAPHVPARVHAGAATARPWRSAPLRRGAKDGRV
eukprot:1006617-Prymnesium_polylepis.2